MNAMLRETSEAFVTGTETIERSIASMREKMDRDNAALAASQAALSERVHQNYSTLIDRINVVHHVLRDGMEKTARRDERQPRSPAEKDSKPPARNSVRASMRLTRG